MIRVLTDHTGRPVRLGPLIGQGGEGTVFQVEGEPALVAKVYGKPPDAATGDKLRALVRLARPELLRVAALPTGTLLENGALLGLLMPLVPLARYRPVHFLYSPAHRKTAFPLANWRFLMHTARNCAAAFERLHDAGIVVGDVNHSNLLVADDADVRLIDTDSFQVRDGDRVLRCTVGVPEYTPPELQDQRFDRLDRTPNHDSFGLAVLIFHLLFMGRHPFSGVYLGKGDMPLERAIKEHRFAYGPAARQAKMEPPPLTLHLGATTKPIAALFTRAFAAESVQGARPTAREWKEVFDALGEFAECSADRGHVYPKAVAACPWCELMSRGAPNYFLSVTLTLPPGAEAAPPPDIEELWKRIAAYALPVRKYQRTAVQPPGPPTPLPPGVPDAEPPLDEPPFAPVQHWATAASLLGLLGGLVTIWCSFALGLAFCSLFVASLALFLWYEFPRQRRHNALLRLHVEEYESRRLALCRAASAQEDAERRLKGQLKEFASRFDRLKQELTTTYQEYKALPARQAEDRKQLDRGARDAQLEQYLDGFLILDAQIEQIGAARKASLASFGIETAADLTEQRLSGVPGFGEKLCDRLFKWRASLGKGFRFDPAKGVPPAALAALARKFEAIRRGGAERLRRGVTELEQLTAEAKRSFDRLSEGILHLAREAAKAEQDMTVFR